MKHLTRIILIATTLFSCTNKNDLKINILISEVDLLTKSNSLLIKDLDSIKTNFIQPFEDYNEVVIKEFEINPDTTIKNYAAIINEYPNSFWSHEADKRKIAIQQNRKYWINNKWDFSERESINEVSIFPAPHSCPFY